MPLPGNQFLRSWRVQIGEEAEPGSTPPLSALISNPDKVIESDEKGNGVRVAFLVERDERNVPNNAELEIANLSAETREFIESDRKLKLQLTAGFQGNTGLIFRGRIRNAETIRVGPDLMTQISCGDAEDEFISAELPKDKSKWSAGTPVAKVLLDLVSFAGVGKGNVATVAPTALLGNSPVLKGPYSAHGSPFAALQTLCAACEPEITWSVQNGEFQGALYGFPSVLEPGPIVSPSTGLIGTPRIEVAREKAGDVIRQRKIATFTTVMLPNIRPGIAFPLESDKVTGLYICRTVRHAGDSQGADWLTEVTAEPLAAI